MAGSAADDAAGDVQHGALHGPDAGARAIRGGALNVSGHAAGLIVTAAAAVVLLRHLGVVAAGRYFAVMALVAMAGALSDVGLNLVAQREYVLAVGADERNALLATVLGLRIALVVPAVGVAAAVAVAIGYPSELVWGTVVAGASLLFTSAAIAVTTPLAAELRWGAVAAVDLVRSCALAAGFVIATLLDADVDGFFAVHLPAAIAAFATAAALVGRRSWMRPRLAWSRARGLLRHAAPLAASVAVALVYTRVLVVLVSVLSTPRDVGLFATSARVLELLSALPGLMAVAAFPILVSAGARDEPRLAAALQRLLDVSLLFAGAATVVLALAPESVVTLIGGSDFAEAAPVLRVHALALPALYAAQVWAYGLIAVGRQRALVVMSLLGLAVSVAIAAAAVPRAGAVGGAVAAVAGEAVLAATALALLVRARSALRPRVATPLRILCAVVVGLGAAVVPVREPVQAVVGLTVFGVLVVALRAAQLDVLRILFGVLRRRPMADHDAGP